VLLGPRSEDALLLQGASRPYPTPVHVCVCVTHPSPNDHFEHCPAFRPGLFPLGAASPTFVFVILFVGKDNFPTNHPLFT
jgi:hypothetical protein